MKEKFSVSAAIVTFNNRDKIERTIRSILQSTKGVELSLFVVDNCSTDGTADFVKSAFPEVTVIEKKKNDGFGAGHNAVLPFLKSDFHAVVNPDIILKSDALSELAEFAADHPDVGLLSPQIVFEDGSIQALGKKNPSVRFLFAHRLMKKGEKPSALMEDYCLINTHEPTEISNATGCFMFFKTSVFETLGGFDERFFMYLEDCDIARRAAEISKAVFLPSVEVVHLWERASKTNKKLLLIHISSIVKYFLKWGIEF